MRYIGNKTKLIPFIASAIDELNIDAETACDPFAGTASVASYLKSRGMGVTSGDIMSFSHALQWSYVVVDESPRFQGLEGIARGPGEPLAAVLNHLNGLEPEGGFIHEHFSPADDGATHDRRYFTPENAARIDAIRRFIWDHARSGTISDDENFVLLTALIEAADRVANTTGIYAAYVKSWQPNATRSLELREPGLVVGNGRKCRAYRLDALAVVESAEPFDLLYLDPPYNTRQYAGYYHVPEIIAEGWFEKRPSLRGKTGLPNDREKRTDWSRRRRCELAFEELIASAPCRHILMSYNSEGIISEECIERVLRDRGIARTFRRLEQSYKRYRSDADGENRRYKSDRVIERLYYVRVS